MAERSNTYFVTYVATPPGSILDSELEERRISREDFARQAEMPYDYLCELMRGDHPVTLEIAQKFEQLVGIPARIWINMQESYEYDKMIIAQRETQKPSFFKQMSKNVAATLL